MSQVRAKFTVVGIRRHRWSSAQEVQTIEMQPVTGGSEEDKSFWAATPSGKIELGCLNLDAAAQFELGKTYYVDFRLAE